MFQFTHPVWGATGNEHRDDNDRGVSIHAPRVGCDLSRHGEVKKTYGVSIHAPRVGCDEMDIFNDRDHDVSIHAPRVGCDKFLLCLFSVV